MILLVIFPIVIGQVVCGKCKPGQELETKSRYNCCSLREKYYFCVPKFFKGGILNVNHRFERLRKHR